MAYLLSGIVAALIGLAITRSVLCTAVQFVFGFALAYITLPVIRVDFVDPYLMLATFVATAVIWRVHLTTVAFDEISQKISMAGLFFGVLLVVVAWVSSASMFNASEYRDLIGEVEVVDGSVLTERLAPFDQSQARLVDQGLAENRAEELLGGDEGQGLASYVDVGTMNIMGMNGQLEWAAPLEHDSLGKWFWNDTTPGFIRVNQNQRADAEIYLERDFRCLPSAWFGDNLKRALYEAGHWTVGISEFTFELDDDGNPYWIASLYEHKIGILGADTVAVAIMDPETCEVDEYPLDQVPEWVDRVHHQNFINTQVSDWGRFVHGWSNQNGIFGGNKDVKKATNGMYMTLGADGNEIWYTGIQSPDAKRGTMGFVIVDSRTKKATYYPYDGVTEQGAMRAVEGKVADLRYISSWPIPYVIQGRKTYLSILKDADGNRQMIGLVSVDNRDWVGVGQNLREALRDYKSELRYQGNAKNIDSSVEYMTLQGVIERIGREVADGTTSYYLVLDTLPDKVLRSEAGFNAELAVTKQGDRIKATVFDTEGRIIDVQSLDNLDLDLSKSAAQVKVERRRQEVREREDAVDKRGALKQTIEDMSPEQLRDLQKRLREADR